MDDSAKRKKQRVERLDSGLLPLEKILRYTSEMGSNFEVECLVSDNDWLNRTYVIRIPGRGSITMLSEEWYELTAIMKVFE